jgi:hypothetical protein
MWNISNLIVHKSYGIIFCYMMILYLLDNTSTN